MSDLLNIGKSGLTSARSNLKTTGHNIANVNTEGFSRQRVFQQANSPVVQDGLNMGTGTRVHRVERVHDEFVEKRLQNNLSRHNHFQERASQLTGIEDIFNELDSEGLNKILNRFYNAFRELSNQPENETLRSLVRDSAGLVVKDFNRIRTTLDNSARTIDRRIESEVEDINSLLKNIANLNTKITQLEAGGDQTGDLRDQRDLQILELSKSFEIHTYTDDRNNFVVSAQGVGTLVSAGQYQQLQTGGTSIDRSSNNMDGSVEIYFMNRPGQAITQNFQKGRFSSMLEVRNNDIRRLQERTDDIAYNFANSVNAVHRRGYVNRPIEGSLDGHVPTFDQRGPTTGINFFSVPVTKENAAANLRLSDEVNADLSNITTALAPNAPGDNRVSIAISKLQHEKIMENGATTLEEYYLQTIGQVGLEAGKAKFDAEQAEGILAQTKAVKERISGVSLDEEAANMVRHQHAFAASAKVIQAADEMMKTVLDLKR